MENKGKMRDILMLQAVFLIYSVNSIVAKLASGQERFSFMFFVFYGIELGILGVYAILWQQVIKRLDFAGNSRNRDSEQRKGGEGMKLHVIILLCSVLIASFSQILLKKSAGKTYRSVIFEYLNPYVICGYGMMFLSMFLTILAYEGMEFTNVQIVEATGYVMVLVLSFFFFREKITKRKLLGMLFIFAGIAVYHLGR